MVVARRATSSPVPGSGTRRVRSAADVASAVERMASTGASARPTTRQVTPATITSTSGSPTSRSRVTTSTDRSTISSVLARTTIRGPEGASAWAATAMNRSLSCGSRTVVARPATGSATRGGASSPRASLDCRTRPWASRIWATVSSLSLTSVPGVWPAATTPAAASTCWRTDRSMLLVSASRRMKTTATPPAASATPTTSVASAVVRTRTDRGRRRRPGRAGAGGSGAGGSATVAVQPVALAPAGLDGVPAVGPVDLVAQPADVDLDDVGVAEELVVPDVVEHVPLGHHVAPVAQQVLQHCQLASGQLDLVVAPPGPALGRVDPQVAGRQHRRPIPGLAAHQRPQPGYQYRMR